MEVVNAIGRRKSAVARVYLSEGTGKITINKKDINQYFPGVVHPLWKIKRAILLKYVL